MVDWAGENAGDLQAGRAGFCLGPDRRRSCAAGCKRQTARQPHARAGALHRPGKLCAWRRAGRRDRPGGDRAGHRSRRHRPLRHPVLRGAGRRGGGGLELRGAPAAWRKPSAPARSTIRARRAMSRARSSSASAASTPRSSARAAWRRCTMAMRATRQCGRIVCVGFYGAGDHQPRRGVLPQPAHAPGLAAGARMEQSGARNARRSTPRICRRWWRATLRPARSRRAASSAPRFHFGDAEHAVTLIADEPQRVIKVLLRHD